MKYLILHLRAPNTPNGNPNRVYVVVDTASGGIVDAYDEGYSDLSQLVPKEMLKQSAELMAGITVTATEAKRFLKLGTREGGLRKNPYRGKFEGSGKLGEALHEMVSDSSFLDDELGDVNDFGWYGLVIDAKVPGHRGMIHAIVNEDSQGFFDVTVYPSKAKAHTAWDRVKDEYDTFCDERGDDGEGYAP